MSLSLSVTESVANKVNSYLLTYCKIEQYLISGVISSNFYQEFIYYSIWGGSFYLANIFSLLSLFAFVQRGKLSEFDTIVEKG